MARWAPERGRPVRPPTRSRNSRVDSRRTRRPGHHARSPNSEVSAGHEQRAHHEGVDQHADGHHEGELAERAQRDDGQQGERGGQRQPGHRDRARRLRRGDGDRLAQAHAPRLVPDAPGDEHVVVRAQRDEQHGGGERDVVGDVVLAQDALEEERAEPEGGQQAQDARGDEVQRRDQRAHEEREQQQVDEDGDDRHAREVGEHARDGVVGQRGLPAVDDPRRRSARRCAAVRACGRAARAGGRSPARRAGRCRRRPPGARRRRRARPSPAARAGAAARRRPPPRRRRAGGGRAPAGARAARARPATPGARTSTSVGETIPGAKPRLAASSARRTWSPAGSARTRLSPSAVERTLRAAKTSSPMAMSAMGSATGREEATRDTHETPARGLVLARELARAPHGGDRAGEAQRELAAGPAPLRARRPPAAAGAARAAAARRTAAGRRAPPGRERA